MKTMREVAEPRDNALQTIEDEQKILQTDFEQAVLKSFFKILEKSHHFELDGPKQSPTPIPTDLSVLFTSCGSMVSETTIRRC